ncbi:uncharacterized protein B0T15DRAFT_577652 [Chaetomium strumarium]|uniref:Uncharacterized protein n=1 Tax=Chaetomium strumarium TaxID=1170767 RepID=A0AAJ0LYN7_9PEZI|nr:hypothetical protein B0T15DRAFT_577652 [Chaetomium strumarium]
MAGNNTDSNSSTSFDYEDWVSFPPDSGKADAAQAPVAGHGGSDGAQQTSATQVAGNARTNPTQQHQQGNDQTGADPAQDAQSAFHFPPTSTVPNGQVPSLPQNAVANPASLPLAGQQMPNAPMFVGYPGNGMSQHPPSNDQSGMLYPQNPVPQTQQAPGQATQNNWVQPTQSNLGQGFGAQNSNVVGRTEYGSLPGSGGVPNVYVTLPPGQAPAMPSPYGVSSQVQSVTYQLLQQSLGQGGQIPNGGLVPTQPHAIPNPTPRGPPQPDLPNPRNVYKISHKRSEIHKRVNKPSLYYQIPQGLGRWGPEVNVAEREDRRKKRKRPSKEDMRPVFDYVEVGDRPTVELSWVTLTKREIELFLGGWAHPSPMNRRLILWVQNTPAQSKHRFVNGEKSGKCRLQDCVEPHNTISKGFWRLAFDEFSDGADLPQTNPSLDPYHNAAYMHLHCFENTFDLGFLIHHGARQLGFEIRPDTRTFLREEKNTMSVTRDHQEMIRTYNEWVENEKDRADLFKNIHPGYTGLDGPYHKQHNQTLGYALTSKHLELETKAREKTRAKRRKNGEGSADIEIHMGDLASQAGKRKRQEDNSDDISSDGSDSSSSDGQAPSRPPKRQRVAKQTGETAFSRATRPTEGPEREHNWWSQRDDDIVDSNYESDPNSQPTTPGSTPGMYREEFSQFDWNLMEAEDVEQEQASEPSDPPAEPPADPLNERREALRQQILGLTPWQLVDIQEQVRRREAQGGLTPTPNGWKQKAQSF